MALPLLPLRCRSRSGMQAAAAAAAGCYSTPRLVRGSPLSTSDRAVRSHSPSQPIASGTYASSSCAGQRRSEALASLSWVRIPHGHTDWRVAWLWAVQPLRMIRILETPHGLAAQGGCTHDGSC